MNLLSPSLRILQFVLQLALFLNEFILLVLYLSLKKHFFDENGMDLCVPVVLQPRVGFLLHFLDVRLKELAYELIVRDIVFNLLQPLGELPLELILLRSRLLVPLDPRLRLLLHLLNLVLQPEDLLIDLFDLPLPQLL